MTVQERRARERAERHRLIIAAARDLAETEGWEAVTTRRLAERVEYSQPVLYSHFAGKEAIVRAVAAEGFGELAGVLRHARLGGGSGPARAVRAVAEAFLDFARARPALYSAMFVQPIDLDFGGPEAPAELRAAFAELTAALAPLTGARDVETLAEVVWAALHGLAVLDLSARLRPDHRRERLDLLLRQFTTEPASD